MEQTDKTSLGHLMTPLNKEEHLLLQLHSADTILIFIFNCYYHNS